MKNSKLESPWVLLELNNVIYATSCESVLSLNQLPDATPLPKSPPEVRGVINFRGRLIELLDTRILLNIKTILEEINEFNIMLNQRYQDHCNWLANLENTVKNDTEFTLTTDPHKCAFGKWYDSYNSKNTNIMFSSTFAKFDKPHKAIHNIGITAQQLINRGEKQAAIDLIESTKNTELKQMMGLFDDLKEAYHNSRKEIVVVIGESESKCIGLSVDQITAIEQLSEFDENLVKDSMTDTEYIAGIAKRKDGFVVLILNEEYLLDKYS
jgi:chemotaxis signal transduction protein